MLGETQLMRPIDNINRSQKNWRLVILLAKRLFGKREFAIAWQRRVGEKKLCKKHCGTL